MKLFLSCILVVIIITLGIMIGMRNETLVEVNFLFAKMPLSLSIVMAISFGLGFLLTWLICALFYFKIYLSNKLLKRKLTKMTMQLMKKDENINQLKHSKQLDADFMISHKKAE